MDIRYWWCIYELTDDTSQAGTGALRSVRAMMLEHANIIEHRTLAFFLMRERS